jgi:hypothetical protein
LGDVLSAYSPWLAGAADSLLGHLKWPTADMHPGVNVTFRPFFFVIMTKLKMPENSVFTLFLLYFSV